MFLVSDNQLFVNKILSLGDFASQCIVNIEILSQGQSEPKIKWSQQEAVKLLKKHALVHDCLWWDELCDGATDARFVSGFGDDLGSSIKPVPIPSVARILGNYVCPTAGGFNLEIVEQCLVPLVAELPARRLPMWHNDALLPQGLFSC